jgi:hypothetical protein
MLQHEKKHKRKIVNNETMKVKCVFQPYGKTYQSGFQLVPRGVAKHKCI